MREMHVAEIRKIETAVVMRTVWIVLNMLSGSRIRPFKAEIGTRASKRSEIDAAARLMTAALFLLAIFALLVAGPTGDARAFGPRNDAPAEYREGVVLLAFRSGVSTARQQEIIAGIGGIEIKRIGVGVRVVRDGSPTRSAR